MLSLQNFYDIIKTFLCNFETLNEVDANAICKYIIQIAREHKLTIRYENPRNLEFTRLRFTVKTKIPKLNQHFNGILFEIYEDFNKDSLQMNLIAFPPPAYAYIGRDFDKSNYQVYPVLDGTVLTFYYDEYIAENTEENPWRFCTKNAYDASDFIWRGYSIRDLLQNLIDYHFPDFSWEDLDKNYSYTVLYKHPAVHPHGNDKIYSAGDDLSLYKSHIYSLSCYDRNNKKFILEDIFTSYNPLTIEGDIDEYINENLDNGYGFLFLSNTQQNAVIHSNTYRILKAMIYDPPIVKNRNLQNILRKQYNNMRFVLVSAYVRYYKNTEILQNFLPQYSDIFTKISNEIDAIISIVYTNLQGQGEVKIKNKPKLRKIVRDYTISAVKHINPRSPNLEVVLKNFIVRKEKLPLLYEVLVESKVL